MHLINRSASTRTTQTETKEMREAVPNAEATHPVALALKSPSTTSRRLTLTAAFSLDNPNSPVTSSKEIHTSPNNGRQRKNSFTVQSTDEKSVQTNRELISAYINEDNLNKPKNRLTQSDSKASSSINYDTKEDESKSQSSKNSQEKLLNDQIKAINNLEERIPIPRRNLNTPFENPLYVKKSDDSNRNLESSKPGGSRLRAPQAQSSPKPFRLIIGVGRSSNASKGTKDRIQTDYITKETLPESTTIQITTSQSVNYEINDRFSPQVITTTEPNIVTTTDRGYRSRVRNPIPEYFNNKDNNQNERIQSRFNYRGVTNTEPNVVDEMSEQYRIRSRSRLPEIRGNEDGGLSGKWQFRGNNNRVVTSTDANEADLTTEQIYRNRFRNTTPENIHNHEKDEIIQSKVNYRDERISTETSTIYVTPEQIFRSHHRNPTAESINKDERIETNLNYRETTESSTAYVAPEQTLRSRLRNPVIDKVEAINERTQIQNNNRVIPSTDTAIFDVTTEQVYRSRFRNPTSENIYNENKEERIQPKINYRENTETSTVYVTPEPTIRSRLRNPITNKDGVTTERTQFQNNYRLITSTDPTTIDVKTEQAFRIRHRTTISEPTGNRNSGLNERFQSRVNNFRVFTSTEPSIVDQTSEQLYQLQNRLPEITSVDSKDPNEKAVPITFRTSSTTEPTAADVMSPQDHRSRVQNPLETESNVNNVNERFQYKTNRYRIISSTEPNVVDVTTDELYRSRTRNPIESMRVEDDSNNRKLLYPVDFQLSTSTEANLLDTTTEQTYRRRPSILSPDAAYIDNRGSNEEVQSQSTTEPNIAEIMPEQTYRVRGQTQVRNDIRSKTDPAFSSNRRFVSRSTTEIPEIETSTNYRRSDYFSRDRTNKNNVVSDNRESNQLPTLSTVQVTNEIDNSNNYEVPDISIVPTEDTQLVTGNVKLSSDVVNPVIRDPEADTSEPLQPDSFTEVKIKAIDNSKENNEFKLINNFKPRFPGRNKFRGRPQYQTTTKVESYDEYDETSYDERTVTDASTTQRSRFRQPVVRGRAQTDTKTQEDNTLVSRNKQVPRIIAVEIQPVLNEPLNLKKPNNPIIQLPEKINEEITNIAGPKDPFVVDIPVPSKPFLQTEYSQENLGFKEIDEVLSTENSLPISNNQNIQRQNQYQDKLSSRLINKPSNLNIPVTSPEAVSTPEINPAVRNFIKSRFPVKNNDPIEIETAEPSPNLEKNSKPFRNSTTKSFIVKPSLSFKSQLLKSEMENHARPRAPQSSPVRCSQLDSECNEKSFVRYAKLNN